VRVWTIGEWGNTPSPWLGALIEEYVRLRPFRQRDRPWVYKHHARGDMMIGLSSTTMTCGVCQLSGGPFEVDEAALHVATHNRFHHAGAPIAVAMTAARKADQAAAA
jgi:hypothetical protein